MYLKLIMAGIHALITYDYTRVKIIQQRSKCNQCVSLQIYYYCNSDVSPFLIPTNPQFISLSNREQWIDIYTREDTEFFIML